jgi:hypothetical protein
LESSPTAWRSTRRQALTCMQGMHFLPAVNLIKRKLQLLLCSYFQASKVLCG